jgi:hypothetical protein
MSETTDSSAVKTAADSKQLSQRLWWRRITAWSARLKVLCALSIAWLFVGHLLRLDPRLSLAPVLLVASSDLLAMTWRVFRDPESELLLKIFGATIGLTGATWGRAYAASRVAEAIGADANIAPYCQQLLSVAYGLLYTAGLLSVVVIVLGIVVGCALWLFLMVVHVAETLSSTLGHILLALGGYWAVCRTMLLQIVWLARAVFRRRELRGNPPDLESQLANDRVTHTLFRLSARILELSRVLRPRLSFLQVLRGISLFVLMMWFLQVVFAKESATSTTSNVVAMLAVKLDFRPQASRTGQAECLNLETISRSLFIASIPNVDDSVLTARCANTWGEARNRIEPWCQFKRERCCRLVPCSD